MPCPLHTSLNLPHDELAARVAGLTMPALLESGPGFGNQGRWSILAAWPRLTFHLDQNGWIRKPWGKPASHRGPASTAFAALDALLTEFDLAQPRHATAPDVCPFQGGLIGALSYDLAPRLERLPRRHSPDSRFPEIQLALYDTFVTIDHATNRANLWTTNLFDEPHAVLAQRHDAFLAKLEQPPAPPGRTRLESPPRTAFSPEEYIAAVETVRDYIRAGDVFQVNLAQRFEARAREIDAFQLYQRLKSIAPAPYAAFLRRGSRCVLSASPESFYATNGRAIITKPIKGTRPRSSDPKRDATLKHELISSPKDRAELTMIIDVERNDLGRVCDYATVHVVEPFAVESYAQVHHLVATIEGRLRESTSPVDVLRAMFPGGSITGAPKIRAMEIIDELEKNRRGLYTGAIGYFSRGGTSAFNIAIRTMLIEGKRITYQVGGGIVADSDPQAEFQETLDKGRGMHDLLSEQCEHRAGYDDSECTGVASE